MKATLYRTIFLDDRTLGMLFVNGTWFAVLEPPKKEEGKPRAIPAGNYNCEAFVSSKAKGLTFKLKNVPDFRDVTIHIGNYPSDTKGCLLLGMSFAPMRGGLGTYQSIAAMDLFREVTDLNRGASSSELEIREILTPPKFS